MRRFARRDWMATLGVLIALWLPLVVSPYPPFYDYPAHLLEARVAVSFADPAFDFTTGYVWRERWPVDTNALATLAMTGLGQLVSLELAGRLALGLVLAIFLFGWRALLQRSGSVWPMLLLTPLLAYNFTFTSGWINFMLGLGLGLCALATFRSWLEDRRSGRLAWLALLLILIYSAHLFVWALMIGVLWVEYATGRIGAWRDRWTLFAATTSALPLLLVVRPLPAVLIGVGPLIAIGVIMLRRLRLPPSWLVSLTVTSAAGLFGLSLLLEPYLQQLDPEVDFSPFMRLSFLARTFTQPHQIAPATEVLSLANVTLLALLAAVFGLLGMVALRCSPSLNLQRLAPVGALMMLYGLVPSATADLAVIEPRIVLLAVLLVLAALPLPAERQRRRALVGLTMCCGIIALCAAMGHAVVYRRQATLWMDALRTVDRPGLVLVVRSQAPSERTPWHVIETYYDGSYFSAMLPFERGGSSSRVFGNGSFYLRPDLEVIRYRWEQRPLPDPDACSAARSAYDRVLGWPGLEPQVRAKLDACYGPGTSQTDLTIWRE